VERSPISGSDGFPSIWVLLARTPVSQSIPALQSHVTPYDGPAAPLRLWTDDFSNLFQILK